MTHSRRGRSMRPLWVLLLLVASSLLLLPAARAEDLLDEEAEDQEEGGVLWKGMDEAQFEQMDRMFSEMGSATHNAALDDMSEDELHAELRRLIRQMQPAKGPGLPQLDLTQFHQIHDDLARVLDPTGKHAREVAEAVSNGTRHSRRLSYIGIINSAGYGINKLVLALEEKSNKTDLQKAGAVGVGIANIVVTYKPASCKWKHLTFSEPNRLAFEKCTGVEATMRYVEELNLILFVISTLISPGGMAFMGITAVINALLDRSCQKDVTASSRGRREFWTFDEIFEIESPLGFWEQSKRSASPKAAAKFVQDLLLGPIYNVCRFLGKLGIKQFDKAAKVLRPYMKASRIKEEKYSDWCDKQSKFRRYVKRVLELQQILNTLWGIIREPIKLTLTDGVCRSTNALAKNFELANFDAVAFFPGCYNGCDAIQNYYETSFNRTISCAGSGRRTERQLTGGDFDFEAGANAIFARYTTKMSSGLMTNLARFHEFDEALLNAWKDSGIETALNILYDAITEYDDLMTTITNVFEASLGSVLEFAKKIIDKLGEFLCDSGEVFTEEAAAVTPAPDCGVVGQVLNFVKATVDLLLSFIDGAIDYLVGLVNEALIDAIPELRLLFSPFQFDSAWDDLIEVYIARVNASMVEMLESLSEGVSLRNFSPNEDLALFYANVVRPATPIATQISYERFPTLTFTCPPNRIPIVLDLNYKAENCDLDLGAPFRFPCNGNDRTCTRTSADIEQYVRSCFTPDPVTPADFLENLERYSLTSNYICFDVNEDLSVLGELISYPLSSSSLNPTARNPQVTGNLTFEGGLRLPIGKYAASYPENVMAGFNTVIYIEEASLSNDLCFSKSWQTAVVADLPTDFRYKWYLCHYLQKNNLAGLTGAMTLPSTAPTADKIAAMNAKLGRTDYATYSTCQYKAKTTYSATFRATYNDAPDRIDCEATDTNNGNTAGPFATSCDATLVGGTSTALGGNYYDDPVQYKYSCDSLTFDASRTLDSPSTSSTIVAAEGDFSACIYARTLELRGCGECNGEGGVWDVLDSGVYVHQCYDFGGCLTFAQIGGAECALAAASKENRTIEINKKYETLQTWLANRGTCATLPACTGQKSCDWSTCKPGVLEHTFTNELQPRFPNSAVKWVFWGGYKQKKSAAYSQELSCSDAGMVPVLLSVEASWGLFTSYGFNVSADVPFVTDARPYYKLNPTTLKATLDARGVLRADTETVTFRAEYKCLCPPGYEIDMGSFNNITSCTPCANGHYRAAGMPACAACPFGTYENGAHTQCLACPAGTFNNGTARYYNATANILGCETCPGLHVSTPGSSYCYPCDKLDPRRGSYFPTGGGANTYASNSTTCTSCVDHLYTNGTANSTSLGCVRCEKGYYRFQNMTDCAPAPPGMHMNEEFDSYNVYPDVTNGTIRRRSLLYLVGNMRRYLQRQQNDTNSNSTFPIPAQIRSCTPGTYTAAFASTTCLSCPKGSYQPEAGQARCIACPTGFTTRDFGMTNATSCRPLLPDDFEYSANLTCLELLAEYADVADIVLIGDGLCNRGPLNTPNCGYDGGDCCVQTCKSGGTVPMLSPSDMWDLEIIQALTNDTEFIATYNQTINGTDDFQVSYSYSCSPFTFDCRDPAVINAPLNCSAPKPPTPEFDTSLPPNATCGENYKLDPNYGDGFCDERLNYVDCNYDGGDCCQQSCRLNRLIGKSCTSSSFQCRDPRSNDTTLAYINPPLVFKECYPFYYRNGFRDLRVQTAITTNPDPCARKGTLVTQLLDRYLPTPNCPGNFTLLRAWDITDLNTSTTNTQNQTVNLYTTIPPPYEPRPICLWRNATMPFRPYSFGLLQTSPFFGFGDVDLCTVSIDVTFVSCSQESGTSPATCDYDSATDELIVSGLFDGDVWRVTVELTDSCGNTNVVSSTVAASASAVMPASLTTLNNVTHSCVVASPYEHSIVSSRLPLLTNPLLGNTAQICTEATLYNVPTPPLLPLEAMLTPYQMPPAIKFCVAVTRAPRQCAASAESGRLAAIFLDTAAAFSLSDPSVVEVVNASIRIASNRCQGLAGLAACGGYALNYTELQTPVRSFNLALLVDDTTWAKAGNLDDLGCFFVQAFGMTRPLQDVDLALVYTDVNDDAGRYSIMLDRVATDNPLPLALPNAQQNVISNRIVPEEIFPNELVCVRVEPRIIDESTTAICLSTTTQYPGCVSSSPSGSLDMLYLDTNALGLADPFAFTFESGHDNITVLRPYCVRRDGATPLACNDYLEPPTIGGEDFLVALPLDSGAAVWNRADQSIGCLYTTHPDLYQRALSTRRNLEVGNTDSRFENWPLAFRFTTPEGPAFMGGLTFTAPPAPGTLTLADQCPRNTVFVRSPQGDNEGRTTQVCTAVNVRQVDYSTLEMCLGVEDSLPQCVSSSSTGKLEALFLDSTAFGGLMPAELSVEDGTIAVGRPLCTQPFPPNLSVTRCRDESIEGLPSGGDNSTFFNAAFTVSNNVAWSGTRSTQLGCFYVKRFDGLALTLPAPGWSLGFAYSGTDGNRKALSAAKVCTPVLAPVAKCGAKKRTLKKLWIGAPPNKADPDRIFTEKRKVCTNVEVTEVDDRTTRVCLAVTTQGAGCHDSATTGTLTGVFFDSNPWAVADSRDLNVENGTIQFQTPFCTSRSGEKDAGRVDRCGPASAANSLRLNKKLAAFQLDVGLTVANSVSWSGTGDQALGCFYITGPERFDVGRKNHGKSKKKLNSWDVGLRFNNVLTNKDLEAKTQDPFVNKWGRRKYSIMLGKVCGGVVSSTA